MAVTVKTVPVCKEKDQRQLKVFIVYDIISRKDTFDPVN